MCSRHWCSWWQFVWSTLQRTRNSFELSIKSSLDPRYRPWTINRIWGSYIPHELDGETELHGDFIQRDKYCDSLVWYANLVPPDDNRKYEYIGTKRDFRIWFTDVAGNVIQPDNFKVFLKLIYWGWGVDEVHSSGCVSRARCRDGHVTSEPLKLLFWGCVVVTETTFLRPIWSCFWGLSKTRFHVRNYPFKGHFRPFSYLGVRRISPKLLFIICFWEKLNKLLLLQIIKLFEWWIEYHQHMFYFQDHSHN